MKSPVFGLGSAVDVSQHKKAPQSNADFQVRSDPFVGADLKNSVHEDE